MLETCPPIMVVSSNRPRARPERSIEGLTIDPELLDDFLAFLNNKGRTPETLQTYRDKLYRLYDWLPADKQIRRGTLDEWRTSLLQEGYAPRSVNLCISAANSLLEVCERRDLQVGKPLKPEGDVQPELTRSEYLRLLSTARMLGKEREYLMVKVFATTGIGVRDLPGLTVEAAETGKVKFPNTVLHIPDCLKEELTDFARREGVLSGPIFVTRTGQPLRRTSITAMIQRLSQDAKVPEGKANPRCLKKLYQTTQANIQANIALLVEQSHDRLLDTEQFAIGWRQDEVVGK